MVALRHIKREKDSLPVNLRGSKTCFLKNPISLSTPHAPDIIVHLYHLVIECTNLPSIHYLFSCNEKALFCANKPCYFLLQWDMVSLFDYGSKWLFSGSVLGHHVTNFKENEHVSILHSFQLICTRSKSFCFFTEQIKVSEMKLWWDNCNCQNFWKFRSTRSLYDKKRRLVIFLLIAWLFCSSDFVPMVVKFILSDCICLFSCWVFVTLYTEPGKKYLSCFNPSDARNLSTVLDYVGFPTT